MHETGTARKIAIAAGHILDEEGADAVTMRRVATDVGITPMALYRHYPDRAGLLNALADAGFEDLTKRLARMRLPDDIEGQLGRVLDIYLDLAIAKPRLFELMFLKPRKGARRFPEDFKAGASPTANVMAGIVQQGIESGSFRDDDAWEITFEMGAMLQGLVMLHVGGRTNLSATRFRALCHRSFRRYLHGIYNRS